jgi:hypothetical protein
VLAKAMLAERLYVLNILSDIVRAKAPSAPAQDPPEPPSPQWLH